METDHPPRDKQAYLAQPSLWVAEPTDDSLSLLENALREDEPSLRMTNIPKTFTRSVRRMPGFAGLWFSYRTSSAKTSFTQDNAVAVSWQNRCQCWRARAQCPRSRSYPH